MLRGDHPRRLASVSALRAQLAGILKDRRIFPPVFSSKRRPFPFATETHLTAFGNNSSTTYTAVIHIPSYAFAISADLPPLRYNGPAYHAGVFHRAAPLICQLSVFDRDTGICITGKIFSKCDDLSYSRPCRANKNYGIPVRTRPCVVRQGQVHS